MLRWLALWLLLTGIYLAGQMVIPLAIAGSWSYTREDLAHLAAVPLVQVGALWVVAWVRRGARR